MVLTRVAPHDLDAEQGVLGGMLLSKTAIDDVLEVLHGNEFYTPAHESIFMVIVDLYNASEPTDAIAVAKTLDGQGLLAKVGEQPIFIP